MAMHDIIAAPADRVRTQIAVLGSGPGGAITAALLAEGGRDVLLVEEGPFLPLESCVPFSRAEMVTKYRNGGITVTMGQSKVAYVEGRCVGGGSEINSGLYHRTPGEVLDDWRRQFTVDALSEADLAPHFAACEQDVSVSYLDGPAPPASLKLHEGAGRLGWKSLEVPRWFRAGAGKQSMSRTFVPRLLAAGGRLLPQTRALWLRRRNEGWRIHAEHRGRRFLIEANVVFVACGAIQTPALLGRSGFRGNIGSRLHMHPTIKVVARFDEEINAPGMGVPVHQVKEFAPRFSFGCSISGQPHLALALAEHPDIGRDVPRDWRRLAVYYAMIRGGTGSVRTLPCFRDPLVRYRLETQDQADLAQALSMLCQCLLAAGATALYPALTNGPCLTSPADLAKLPQTLTHGQANLMTIHLFASCPMGEDRRVSAVNSFGRLHGARGLYVADASILCGPPGVNPQGSIMALARRNALRFLG